MRKAMRGEECCGWRRWLVVAVLACIGAATLVPATARAQAAEEQYLRREIQSARTHYEMLELQEAEKVLEAAISSARSSDEAVSGAMLARAWVMLGIVRFGARRNADETESAFVKALRADPDATLPEVYVTPRLRSIWESASERAKTGRSPEVEHVPIEQARAGESLKIEAAWKGDRRAGSAVVRMRRVGEKDWTEFQMAPTERDVWTLSIPGRFIGGERIEYVVEFLGTEGAAIGRSASLKSPHEVPVIGTAEESDVVERGGYIDLLVGTGVTYLTEGGEPTANPDRTVNPGLATSVFQVWLEGGWRITDRAHLGLYLRYQFSPTQDFDAIRERNPGIELGGFTDDACFGVLPGDCLLGVRSRLLFGQPDAKLRGFSSVNAGVGRIRDLIRMRESASSEFCQGRQIHGPSGSRYCYRRDTVRPGWLHLGVGGGVIWQFSDHVGLLAEATMMVLFPDPGLHLDVNVGPRFRF